LSQDCIGMSGEDRADSGIGTLSEQSLHAALKQWYAQPGDRLEAPVDRYIVDIVRQGLLIEVQTSGFASIKGKLRDLVQHHRVLLVYPVAAHKWIVRQSGDGKEQLGRRKSPKRGRLEQVFSELVSFPHLVRCPTFSLEVVLVQEEEVRRKDGRGSWRRRGWSIHDRRLLAVDEQFPLSFPSSYLGMVPPGLPVPFTSRDLGRALDVPRRLAGQMAYCLREMAVLHVVGKRGHAYLYQAADGGDRP
jgi:hypothetical protein